MLRVTGTAKRLVGLAALFALGGCDVQFAQGPTVGQSQASIAAVPPDRGRIFIYRPYAYVASQGHPPVQIDQTMVVEAKLDGAFYCDVAPGSHEIWSLDYMSSQLRLIQRVSVTADHTAYFRVSPNFSTGYDFEPVGPDTGARESQSMHLVAAQCGNLAVAAAAAPGNRAAAATASDRPPVDDTLASGSAAEERGDLAGALKIYTSALQKYVTRMNEIPDVVDRAIDIAIKMRPTPAIPEDARRHAAAAADRINQVRIKADFAVARRDYADALAVAPWWADVWVNVSIVDEQLGNPADVRRDLVWYLRANPDAPDQAEVRRKIDALGRTKAP
jgi:hypothetical protein